MNRQFFYKIYWNLQSFIAPHLRYSQSIYEGILEDIFNRECSQNFKWLDLGCGHQLLPPWRLKNEKILVKKPRMIFGIDYDFISLTKHKTITNLVRGDISSLPFLDNTFDLITSNMVFEHLYNPEKQLCEIARVLKVGGKLIFHTPNKYGYATLMAQMIPESMKDKLVYILQRRKEEDIFPAYYKNNTPSQIKSIAISAGFKVQKIKMVCSSAQFVVLPPIVIIELIWIRFLMTKVGKPLRTNIIAFLEKTKQSVDSAELTSSR